MKLPEPWWATLPRTNFGSSRTEERLAALVLAGRKRATVWDARHENPTAPGMQWVVTVKERPVAVIETVRVQQHSFHSIDTAFAFEEGEGDRTLAFWRSTHKAYFRSEGNFAPDMMLWSEHFRLIEVLDPALAAAADTHVAAEQAEGEALTASLQKIETRELP